MIAACCILHNICIENGEPDPKIGDSHDNYDNNDDFVDGGASSNADAVKDVLIRNLLNCKKKNALLITVYVNSFMWWR